MARNIQSLWRITSNVFNWSITQNICVSGIRSLYTASALGLESYRRQRENINNQFHNVSDNFRERMLAAVKGESTMIFTEDLKNMFHLANDNPSDFELLSKMLVKFNSQNKELRFGSFVFGPVAMRTYHHFNKADEAFSAFNNPDLKGVFFQVSSCQILMDLLFEQARYADVRQVWDTVQTELLSTGTPQSLLILLFAACYKENSPESFEYAINVHRTLKNKGGYLVRRASTFFAGLALHQGRPDIAVEITFSEHQSNYVSVRLLKVAALAELDRLHDVLSILRNSLTFDRPNLRKHVYPAEVIERVEKAIERAQLCENEPIVTIVKQLKLNEQIENSTLDDILCLPIQGFVRNNTTSGEAPSKFKGYNRNQRIRRAYTADSQELY
ncbi:pentatricopeptide repeat-containing protein 2, mitochondrial-like [Diprion similis]|uniref:pentatricopeptide repeat-containing protein 2, mitochondrial-like n=1 Tax=Diprion similis TaxID=362088 RepID=UPI001EF88736|nr:pentatricopeptide repeat-containing protein 2, mitochondrial-like [Diprion similis]